MEERLERTELVGTWTETKPGVEARPAHPPLDPSGVSASRAAGRRRWAAPGGIPRRARVGVCIIMLLLLLLLLLLLPTC